MPSPAPPSSPESHHRPQTITILDGGTGHVLKSNKAIDTLCLDKQLKYEELFAAGSIANELCPDIVAQVHADYIAAGADVITANTFGCTRWSLGKIGRADQAIDLAIKGATIARNAASSFSSSSSSQGKQILVAASIPPLEESYRVPLMSSEQRMKEEYRDLAIALSPLVDILLCETMSSIFEAYTAAATCAQHSNKPIWISFTLDDSIGTETETKQPVVTLRSGESIQEALRKISPVPRVQAILFNCSAPEVVLHAISISVRLVTTGKLFPVPIRVGGYANGFKTTTSEWLSSTTSTASMNTNTTIRPVLLTLLDEEYDEGEGGSGGIILPEKYGGWVQQWMAHGATIVGGCCGIGPQHIQCVHDQMQER